MNANPINSEKAIGQFKAKNANASHNNALNHDPPHWQTALVCGWSVFHTKFCGLRRQNAVVVGHISAAFYGTNRGIVPR